MNQKLREIAEAVRASLQTASDGGQFSTTFTAERRYVVEEELQDLGDGILVGVVGINWTRQRHTRASWQTDYVVSVGLLKRLATDADPTDPADNATTDALMDVVQEIVEHFDQYSRGPGIGATGATFVGAETEAAYHTPWLRNSKVFASVNLLTFRVFA